MTATLSTAAVDDVRNAELFHLLSHKAGEFGFSFDNLSFDWEKVIGRSRSVSG